MAEGEASEAVGIPPESHSCSPLASGKNYPTEAPSTRRRRGLVRSGMTAGSPPGKVEESSSPKQTGSGGLSEGVGRRR